LSPILRDAFYGVRRFSDFRIHLDVPKAVLSQRLSLLVDEHALSAENGEYLLTIKGRPLWPAIAALAAWGSEHYLEADHRRTFEHADCGGRIIGGRCSRCAAPHAGATQDFVTIHCVIGIAGRQPTDSPCRSAR
jgi:DNA-binding HxlR family transcriptional regulator